MNPYLDILIKDALEKVFPDQLPIRRTLIFKTFPSAVQAQCSENVPLRTTVRGPWYRYRVISRVQTSNQDQEDITGRFAA